MQDNILTAVKEAIEKSKERKFLESVDLAINLKDVDLSIPKNRINEEVILPHGRGKEVKIGVFASGETALKAKNCADLVIAPEEIEKLAEDKRKARKIANKYDFFLAEAPLMGKIGKSLGIILGPRGKMPKPLPPGADPCPLVERLKKTVRMRSRDKRTFHVPVGTKNMEPEKIAENIEEVIKRLETKLERGLQNIDSVYVKTTMGPAVKIKLR
ncbi:50S ribosomal protein L1 [Candidatus Aciduliprofundum boonei]|uniref:Large ribosomal subunit protein uL1 n=1 Tax=Aciduliprofundum boonei (strain DSM 19572 / T469) TaxID=439481 RepID=B5IAH3_ACIB4|nr:50S ribosomal protein L1 [Candidatus Aciduliprofundum boonei]ADD08671.1 ribosomal protein L1 [Aciduliprofundum boonei T469]EDY36967.1 ribosomal protein, L1P family [Aciduliprofundum boonei T469]HII55902.1 50S ribosomal protein L1 [Candidatus Aciduliprofundum boonei]